MNYYTPICYRQHKGELQKLTFSKYVIDENGRVFSLNYNHTYTVKECVGAVDKDGYVMLCLRSDESGKVYVRRCRISESTFFGEPPFVDAQVNHKDECKTNDAPSNLEWCDSKYNNNYGTKNERAKIKLKQIPHTWRKQPIRVWKYVGDYQSIKEATIELGIECNQPNISTSLNSNAQTCVKGYKFEKILLP